MKVTAKKCCLNRCGTPLITCLHAELFTAVPVRELQESGIDESLNLVRKMESKKRNFSLDLENEYFHFAFYY